MMDAILSWVYKTINQLGYHHPLHATQVHIPIGLIFGAFILGIMAKIRRHAVMARAAWYCTVLALIWILPTVLTGLMDWKHYFAGVWIFPFQMKTLLAGGLTVLLVIGAFWGARRQEVSSGIIVVNALCLLAAAGLGFFGGDLVYGNRPSAATAQNVQLSPAYSVGKEFYAANCGGCHVNGGNVMDSNRPVKGSSKLSDSSTFLAWVRNPNPPMPEYPKEVLSDQQVEDIYRYIVHVLTAS